IPLNDLVLWLDQLRMSDLGRVGGKNASLGEMIGNLANLGVMVPGGFATTSEAFQQYFEQSGLAARVRERLATLEVDAKLCADAGSKDIAVAVRSSATAEDLPDASFAGQQETFLNVVGIDDVLLKVKEVFASLY